MIFLRRLVCGFRGLFRKTQVEHELDAELQEFLESSIDRIMAAGPYDLASIRLTDLTREQLAECPEPPGDIVRHRMVLNDLEEIAVLFVRNGIDNAQRPADFDDLTGVPPAPPRVVIGDWRAAQRLEQVVAGEAFPAVLVDLAISLADNPPQRFQQSIGGEWQTRLEGLIGVLYDPPDRLQRSH
jgi:hypothetical protein